MGALVLFFFRINGIKSYIVFEKYVATASVVSSNRVNVIPLMVLFGHKGDTFK